MMRRLLVTALLLASLSPAAAEDGFFGSAPPVGPASGDLSGSYPGPTVAKVNGNTPPTGIWKNNPPVAAVSGTDYAPATSGSSILLGNGSGGFSSYAGVSGIAHQWISALSAAGAATQSQPACGDLSNSAASCSTDATNASNISSGTLAAARGGAGTITGALKANGSGTVSQAACGDLSNGAASCSTDATNASNISSGTLPSGRLSGTYSGNLTWSGNNTFSGQALHTGTSAPSSAAGQTVVMGTIASPSLTNTGQAFLYNTTANGAILQGDGSANDILILNKGGSVVCSVATGGTSLNCASLLSNSSPVAIQAPAWTTYAPTITATAGTFTTVSAAGSFFASGKSVSFTVTITETAIGTASGKMVLPLPTGTAVRGFIGTCGETASTGKMASYFVAASGSSGNITGYDNATSFIGNGFTVVCSGTYEQT